MCANIMNGPIKIDRTTNTQGRICRLGGVISCYPLVNYADDDERLFLQFDVNVNIKQKLEKLIGFVHPDLIYRRKGRIIERSDTKKRSRRMTWRFRKCRFFTLHKQKCRFFSRRWTWRIGECSADGIRRALEIAGPLQMAACIPLKMTLLQA